MATTDFDVPSGSLSHVNLVAAGSTASSFVSAVQNSITEVCTFTGLAALSSVLVGKSGTAFGMAKRGSSRIDYLCVSAGQYIAIGQISLESSPYTVTIKWKSY